MGPSRSTIDLADGGPPLDDEDKRFLEVGWQLQQKKLRTPYLLGWPSVVCIIANRMIGSGIFSTPSTLMQLTQSVGITMLFWVAGAITTLCGTLMFIEYGLTSPRYQFSEDDDETKRPLPRSGGDLYYLKDVLRKPAYLAVCLYGIAFILLGNIATNSMAFGQRVLEATGRADSVSPWVARGIAIGAIVFTCVLHSTWRIGGIRLSNIFAVTKIAMLVFVFITGCLAWGGVFPRDSDAVPNLTAPDAFKNPSSDAYAFAQAYLSIVFAYGGFNQANYVLGEVHIPKRNYRLPAFLAVLGVCVLYILVNVAYMIVVPADLQKAAGSDVAFLFFKFTYGSKSANDHQIARSITSAFMAISSLGNLIVMTYTAARVKQEIAKEGILPWGTFFANNVEIFGNENNPVPLGSLILHGVVSITLVLATASLAPLQAYRVLVGLYSYTVDAIFGIMLSIGIFVLRSRSKSFAKNSFLPFWVSMAVAAIYGISMAFPVCASFVPPSAQFLKFYSPAPSTAVGQQLRGFAASVPWYLIGAVGWSCVALGALWFVGFEYVYPLKHSGYQRLVERELLITEDGTLGHEFVKFSWKPGDVGAPPMREVAHARTDEPMLMPFNRGLV